MDFRLRVFILFAMGCVSWAGSICGILALALVGNRTGPMGGPPNILIPSAFLGFLLGGIAAGVISDKARNLGDLAALLLALGVLASSMLPGIAFAVLLRR